MLEIKTGINKKGRFIQNEPAFFVVGQFFN